MGDLHDVGTREHVARVGARDGAEWKSALSDERGGGTHDVGTSKRLVALDIYDALEARELGARRHFGDAVGSTRMSFIGEHGLATGAQHFSADQLAVGGDETTIGDAELAHALEDADDNGETGEEAERLPGETRGAQSGWDDGQRLHGRRMGPRRDDARAGRAPDATFTPNKIRLRPRLGNP